MIQTTNYCAREWGVTSGMPGFIGRKLCPQMILIEPRCELYRDISMQFKEILKKYDYQIEGTGLDEGTIDVTDYLEANNINHKEGRIFLASRIRKEIKESTKLTCSCGIAPNKMMAKICSNYKKPDG